jgi:hypothetical protein
MFHELNHASFGWFHVKAILISGVGWVSWRGVKGGRDVGWGKVG